MFPQLSQRFLNLMSQFILKLKIKALMEYLKRIILMRSIKNELTNKISSFAKENSLNKFSIEPSAIK